MPDTTWSPVLAGHAGPKYLALSRALRDAIRIGELVPGQQLPTVRDLAWRLHLTPGTVARAYQLATQEGLLDATVGRGTFVAASSPRLGPTQPLFNDRIASDHHSPVDLRAPQVPQVGQEAILAETLRQMAEQTDTRAWLDYTSQRSESPLRAEVVRWSSDRILGPVSADDVMLCHGGQNGIALILDICLRGERPVVALEELAYPGFRYAARTARADVVAIEIDRHGMVPEALEAACRRQAIQVVCLTSEAQNPTTGCMPIERRRRIAEIARAFDLQLVEDDCYSLAESDIPSLRALAPERTWVVGSLSKTISAALRFGYVICPTGMGDAGRLTSQYNYFALSRPVYEICLALFRSGAAAEIRARVQAEFALRQQAIVNRLGGQDLAWQPGVPFVWLNLPVGWRAAAFSRHAADEGVMVRTADEYALVGGRAPNAVRLAIAGHVPSAEFEAALERLAVLLRHPPSELLV